MFQCIAFDFTATCSLKQIRSSCFQPLLRCLAAQEKVLGLVHGCCLFIHSCVIFHDHIEQIADGALLHPS